MGMAIRDYAQYDGLGLAELVAKKKVKPIELLDEAIVRAERLNPALNAIIFKDYERARDVAKGKLPRGIFTGVPFLLKDIMAFAQGMPTRQGAQFLPPSPVAARFLSGGKIQKGRSCHIRQDERTGIRSGADNGVPVFTVPARNPWNLDAFDRRFVRRLGGGGGGRHCAARTCK